MGARVISTHRERGRGLSLSLSASPSALGNTERGKLPSLFLPGSVGWLTFGPETGGWGIRGEGEREMASRGNRTRAAEATPVAQVVVVVVSRYAEIKTPA